MEELPPALENNFIFFILNALKNILSSIPKPPHFLATTLVLPKQNTLQALQRQESCLIIFIFIPGSCSITLECINQ